MPGLSLGIGLALDGGGQSPTALSTDALFRDTNDSALAGQAAAQTITPANGTCCWGDSLTAGTTNGATPWTTTLAGYLAGIITNKGTSGQTSTQIATRVAAGTAGEKAADTTFWMGTNNSTARTTVLADYASSVAAIGHNSYICIGPIGAGNMGAAMGHLNRISSDLKTTYGSQYLNIQHCLRRIYVDDATERTVMRRGQMPAQALSDGTHPKTIGNNAIAREIGRALRAIEGSAPFVHDQMMEFSSGDAQGTSIGTPRYLGTPTSWAIAYGNSDNLLAINSGTGELSIGAGVSYPATGVRAVFVTATNSHGSHTGRVMLVRKAETDQPIYGVNVATPGSFMRRPIASDETQGFMANGTQISVIMLVRYSAIATSGDVFLTHNLLSKTTGGKLRILPKTAANASMGVSQTEPTAPTLNTWQWSMFAVNSSTGAMKAATNNTSTSTVTGTWSLGTMGLANIDGLFTNNNGDSAPFAGDIKMLWVADTFIDWASSTERDRFFNSSTLAPVTLAADGTVNSITPKIYLRGRAGDWLQGRNFGSGGTMYAPFPYKDSEAVFTDAA